MKKLTSVILTLCMICSLWTAMPLTASAYYTYKVSNGYYIYEVLGGEAIICQASASGAVEIPRTICEYTVTSIEGIGFSGCTSLTSITIPDSVTYIGRGVFSGCTNLTSINIPDSVESIGDDAFYGCTSLTSISIPDSVESIGDDAFYNTAYYGIDSNWEHCVLYVGSYLIEAKSTLSGLYEIRENTRSIADYAFYNCTDLTSINIPDSVESIGRGVFSGCTNLTSINIPDSVESIGDDAFYNTAYYGIDSNWEHCVLYVGSYLIEAKSTLSGLYEIRENTRSIADYAFYNCTDLTSINIPDSVESIGRGVFSGCHSITSVTIPDSVTIIGDRAFQGCDSLKSINIPSGVTAIGIFTFHDCMSLKNVTIGNGVTSIGNYAFDYCDRLTDVYYAGSEEDWDKIRIGYANYRLTKATIHYNYSGATVTKSGTTLSIDNKPYYFAAPYYIIIAGYSDDKLVDMETVAHDEQNFPYTLGGDIDEVRIMVWNSLSDAKPLCNAEVIPSDEFIID